MNKVYLDGERVRDFESLEQFEITMSGQDNVVELHSFEGRGKIFVYMTGTNNRLLFGKGNVVNNSIGINFWNAPNIEPHGSEIVIGDYNYFNGSGNSIIGPLTTKITIGNGNLFAGNITVWGRNYHIVYDIDTRRRLNDDKDIDLGSFNWICEKVTVLPGASLGENSVLGLGSVLNKPLKKNNVLIAGVPAVIKKEGINWSRACNYDEVDFDNNNNIKRKD